MCGVDGRAPDRAPRVRFVQYRAGAVALTFGHDRYGKAIAHQSFRLIENGDVELAEQIIATGFVNEEA